MMAGFNLLDTISQMNNGAGISQIAQQFGLDETQAQSAISSLLPALSSGLRRNVSQEGGLESLIGALQNGNHHEYLERPERLAEPETTQDGNAILGHILGNDQVTEAAVNRAAENSGLSNNLLQQMMPVIASMAMGALSSQTRDQNLGDMLSGALSGGGAQSSGNSGGGGLLGGILGSVLGGGRRGQSEPQQSNPMDILGNMLDADGDGNSMDDIFDMLGRR